MKRRLIPPRPALPARTLTMALLIALAILLLDQLSKHLLLGLLQASPGQRLQVIPGLFDLVVVWNAGVSFGMFGGSGLPPLALVALSLAISAALLWWLWRGLGRWAASAVGLVLGGAIGNAIDRLVWGRVFDFADFYLGHWHWPAFNLADSAIVVGVGMLLIESMFFDKPPAA